MLNIELVRVRVKKGKSEKVDEWLNFLNENMEDTLLTLEDEKMFVESIHRENIDGDDYLYWYSVQGEGGINVQDSKNYIDIKHLEYWNECIDKDYKMKLISTKVVMIPEKIREVME